MKFKITPERLSEACGYVELLNLLAKDRATAFRVAPRFAVEESGEYSMKMEYDDGEITKFIGYDDTLKSIAQVTPKRLEGLIDELYEAAKNVVNPTRGRD